MKIYYSGSSCDVLSTSLDSPRLQHNSRNEEPGDSSSSPKRFDPREKSCQPAKLAVVYSDMIVMQLCELPVSRTSRESSLLGMHITYLSFLSRTNIYLTTIDGPRTPFWLLRQRIKHRCRYWCLCMKWRITDQSFETRLSDDSFGSIFGERSVAPTHRSRSSRRLTA